MSLAFQPSFSFYLFSTILLFLPLTLHLCMCLFLSLHVPLCVSFSSPCVYVLLFPSLCLFLCLSMSLTPLCLRPPPPPPPHAFFSSFPCLHDFLQFTLNLRLPISRFNLLSSILQIPPTFLPSSHLYHTTLLLPSNPRFMTSMYLAQMCP